MRALFETLPGAYDQTGKTLGPWSLGDLFSLGPSVGCTDGDSLSSSDDASTPTRAS